jgi:hypothetical protein
MYRLATLKHGDEFLDLSLSRLGLFDCADPVQNGVPVSGAQRFEEGSGRRICVQRALKIAWHLGAAGRAFVLVLSRLERCQIGERKDRQTRMLLNGSSACLLHVLHALLVRNFLLRGLTESAASCWPSACVMGVL